MNLPRDEIAFRKQYEPFVLNGSLTVVFRPSNRIFPNRRGYIQGESITARIIEQVGSDEKQIAPVFNHHKVKVTITSIKLMSLDELTAADFEGSSPDVQDIQSLQAHIEAIYQQPMDAFGRLVTRIQLDYGRIESFAGVDPVTISECVVVDVV